VREPPLDAPLFTVFTPTFDRAHTLPDVARSLASQTERDFEWVVVDDGSRDGTEELLRGLEGRTPFPLRRVRQDNAGKHVAVNRGVALARGPLFLILDSDDTCVPEALATFRRHWESIPPARREEFAGVTARCVDEAGRLVGDPLPAPVLDATPMDVRYRYRVRGEMWGFVRTDLLRAMPYPEDLRGTYVPESLVWNRIGRTHRTRFVEDRLRVYRTERGESLMRAPDPARHAEGNLRANRAMLRDELDWFRYAPDRFVRAAVHYVRFGLHAGRAVGDLRRELPAGLARWLFVVALPVGWAAYLRDRGRAS